MPYKTPASCPVCGGSYEISTLTCKKCNSELSGHFSGCVFCNLEVEEAAFVLVFLKCRGSIKDVEKELNISYPTVRNRLDAVLKKLGLKSSVPMLDVKEERQNILTRLEKGEISVLQATEMLNGLN